MNARPLHVIAREIKANWVKVNYGAVPYLDAMKDMSSIDEPYYLDSGKSIVLYFLSNATSWKGERAKEIKAELKEMAGIKLNKAERDLLASVRIARKMRDN